MARVLDDALAEMPTPARGSLWRQVLGALGGWPAAAGLAATACVGLWVGGVMSEEFIVTLGIFEGASLDVGSDFGAFDLLLVDG
ncbi:hypothetical protein SAMN05443551_3652 [Marivita hallyeonensis]|uniref:Uncharacterized protein n=2 Tax=Marivita hallyeonensis TaxID=996342 RepID=A0A1M5X0U2_9RHOB|nr:hypothetical protein SAMN05443551_3652 [Marivita hallyeonensis]